MRKFPASTVSYSASSRPPASGVRGALDSLVQGSLVDLFAAYGVAIAPLPRAMRQETPTLPDTSASMSFQLGPQQGRLTLSLSREVLQAMQPSGGGAAADWARELANQLLGRIKNRLLQFSVRLELGIATQLESSHLSQQLAFATSERRTYRARTLRGEVIVTLQGMPEDTALLYAGQASAYSEGDVILF
jgi:hypothetical protein